MSIYNKVNAMDKFYLVLIKKDGTIVHDIFATSHRDLIDKYLTHDEIKDESFFMAQYCPIEGHRLDDVDNYVLLNAGMFYPNWFDGEFKAEVMGDLKTIIGSMIVRGRKKLLLHEGVILSKKVVVEEAKHCVIFAMYDESRVIRLDQTSEVRDMTDEAMVEQLRDGSKINQMWGFSKVLEMHDYSKIMKMFGQSKVGTMLDHSRIAMLKGDANILNMDDEAQAHRLKHMSRVTEMHGHAVIEEMWDWTVVEKMFDNARINFMEDEAKVLEMYDDTMVDQMFGNSIVEKLTQNSLVRKLNDKAQVLRKELE